MKHKKFIAIFSILILLLILAVNACYSFTVNVDSVKQRTNGSKLVDIWYTIQNVRNCVQIIVLPVTIATNETLLCTTFVTPSDTGIICNNGNHHILWDAGTDVPDREFYFNKVTILLYAALPGITPGICPFQPAITAGSWHTVVLKADSTVWTWGNNSDGQLGDGATNPTSLPTQVLGGRGSELLTGVIAIAAGEGHTVALKADGSVWAWGRNISGQLGIGNTDTSFTPVQVHDVGDSGMLTDIIDIAAGFDHTLALKSDGTVYAWGFNGSGQLGDGTIGPERHVPVRVGATTLLTDVVEIAASGWHSMARKADGTVWTWGNNSDGQLGDGTPIDRASPVQVGGSNPIMNIIGIAAGYKHNIVLKSDGTVWTWGGNDAGQLGDGTIIPSRTPIQVHEEGDSTFLANVIDIAAGYWHSLALKSDNTVWAWGFNGAGQLGDGTVVERHWPIKMHGDGDSTALKDVIDIAAGGEHSVALKSNGTVWTCGRNHNGQLGDGTNTTRSTPVQVHNEDDTTFFNVFP